jgi:hypothetical protein
MRDYKYRGEHLFGRGAYATTAILLFFSVTGITAGMLLGLIWLFTP